MKETITYYKQRIESIEQEISDTIYELDTTLRHVMNLGELMKRDLETLEEDTDL